MDGDKKTKSTDEPPPPLPPSGPYRLESDMDLQGQYADSVLEMTDTQFRSLSDGIERASHAVQDVDYVRCIEFVGNGMLEAHLKDGRVVPLIRYSKTLSESFEEAENEVNRRLGRELTDEEREGKPGEGPKEVKLSYRCPNCGHPLKYQSDVCPKCVSIRMTMLRLMKFLRPYWMVAVLSMVLAICMTALSLLPAALFRYLIDGPLRLPEVSEVRRGHTAGQEAFAGTAAFEFARDHKVDGSVLVGTGQRGLVTKADVNAYLAKAGRFATPAAHAKAWAAMVSPDAVEGTGPDGTIRESDVDSYLAQTASIEVTNVARQRAFLLGLDLRDIDGSGPGGEITDSDVKSASRPARYRALTLLVAALVVFFVLRAVLTLIRMRVTGWLAVRLMFDVRSRLYRALQRLSLSFYDREHTGRIMSRVTNDTAVLNSFVVSGFQSMIIYALQIVGICALMLGTHWKLAVLALVPTPLMMLGTYLFARKVRPIYSRIYRRSASLYKVISDAISGVRVVKAFGQEDREIDTFEDKSLDYADAAMQSVKLRSVFSPVMLFLTALGTIVIYAYGGYLVVSGVFTVGSLVMFSTLMVQFYAPVNALTQLTDVFQSAAVASERVFSILDTPSEVADATESAPMPELKGHFVFENVQFAYEKGDKILRSIDLEIQSGEIIGLVGETGSGKSTLVKLVSRFYDPTRGRILLDGVDLREIRLRDLRQNIGMVLQETFLFSGTIRDNIAYGRPGATNEEVVQAARAANAHPFIMNMPDVYDTHVGERGLSLSGGERQRLAIARAILMDPDVLILDEATSAVDTATEAMIQEALDRLMHGRTVFAIAHRLSTLKNANRLVVMDNGAIAEMGTHEELLRRENGIYRNLVEIQNMFSGAGASDENADATKHVA